LLSLQIDTAQSKNCKDDSIIRVGLYIDNITITCRPTLDYDCSRGSEIPMVEVYENEDKEPVWDGYTVLTLSKLQSMDSARSNVTFTIVSLGPAKDIANYTALLEAALTGDNKTLYNATPCDIIGTGDSIITKDRLKFASFSQSILSKQLTLITRNTTYTTESTADKGIFTLLFKPLSDEVWLLFAGIMALFIISLAPIAKPPGDDDKITWGGFMMHTIQSFMGQGGGAVTEQKHARFVVCGWLFFCWILSTFYTANLTALLVKKAEAVPPYSFADIRDQKLPVCVLKGSAEFAIMKSVLNTSQLVEVSSAIEGIKQASNASNVTGCVAAIATSEEYKYFLQDPTTDVCSVTRSIDVALAHAGYMALSINTHTSCMDSLLQRFLVEPQISKAVSGCKNQQCVYQSFFEGKEPQCSGRIPSVSQESIQINDIAGPAVLSIVIIVFGFVWHFVWMSSKHLFKPQVTKMKVMCCSRFEACCTANGLCVPVNKEEPPTDAQTQQPRPQLQTDQPQARHLEPPHRHVTLTSL